MHGKANSPAISERSLEWLARLLSDNVDTAFLFCTPDGLVVDWLGAAERLFGYTRQEALGMPLSRIFTDEDRALELDDQELALALSCGRSEDDRWHVRKNGSRFWASGLLTAVRERGAGGRNDGAVVSLCKMVRDRTDIRTRILSLENQLATRTADLQRRDRVGTFVAHEMLNPMMPITSALALLQKSDDVSTRARACEVIGRQVDVLRGLVRDLNQVSAEGEAQLPVALERTSVNEALQACAEALRASAEANDLSLVLIVPSQPIGVNADPLRLQQMLLNLIGNAIKYTQGGGHITLSATVEGDMAMMRVEDDGRGISPEVLPHIFELFTRENRGGPQVAGMGVGLAVVQDLARRHGGGVEARSPGIGLGSIFSLRLPLFRAGETPAQELSPP